MVGLRAKAFGAVDKARAKGLDSGAHSIMGSLIIEPLPTKKSSSSSMFLLMEGEADEVTSPPLVHVIKTSYVSSSQTSVFSTSGSSRLPHRQLFRLWGNLLF